jgi:hypothetical protein
MGPSTARRAGGRRLPGWLPGLAVGLAALLAAAPAPAQTWFDALVARVNGQPILASDLAVEDALYGQGRPFPAMDEATRDALLNRLIQRRLLLAEAERFGVAKPTEAAVDQQVAVLKKRLGPDPAGLDPATLRATVRSRLWADDFVDARIRAFVFIRDAQVAEALKNRTVPTDPAARASLESQVRSELAAQEADRRLARYLSRLEGRSTIRRYLEPPGTPDGDTPDG